MKHLATWVFVVGTGIALWCALPDTSKAVPIDVASAPQPNDIASPESIDTRATERVSASVAESHDPRTFDEWIERLVALALETRAAVEADDFDEAREVDERARVAIERMRAELPDTEESALHALCGLMSEDETVAGTARRRVLGLVLELGLRVRWQRFEYSGDRARVDRLVEAMLVSLPQDEPLAELLGLGLLADEPFLGPSHERAVLDLVELSLREPFLARVAKALLTTLWQNLEESGARTSGNLASLALVYADDSNPTRRICALRHLLTSRDGRYEHFVMERVRQSRDSDLAVAVGITAARELEPRAALRVLEQLEPVAGASRLTASFLLLGNRAPASIRTAYEHKLADQVAPQLRAEMVTGFGFGDSGFELARVAFEQDPDLEVKKRALFVLASRSTVEIGEHTLLAAIDDDAFTADPTRVGAIVSALDNLANHGDANAVHRVGRRLRVHPKLMDADRRRLDDLLAQHTPPGLGQ